MRRIILKVVLKIVGSETLLDQSFSLENFRKIFDLENRKGNFLEGKYFPELTDVTFEIKQCISDIRTLRRKKNTLTEAVFEQKKKLLYEKRDKFKIQKEEMLTGLLSSVVETVSSKDFAFGISEHDLGLNKSVFREEQNPATFFVLKQLQHNIRKLYKVKQSNRYNIICQIRESLSDKFPKYYFKTDIKSFYESIPRQQILKQLDSDSLLTQTSKKFIRKIMYEYEQISGGASGLPRGIGVSAYLAELYMRGVDRQIQRLPSVKYYARYVDDIFILAFPTPNEDSAEIKQTIETAIENYDLTINQDKTDYGSIAGSLPDPIVYLGYKFCLEGGVIQLMLTDAKIERYKARVDASFSAFHNLADNNPKKAKSQLLKRLRFLTGNTRLSNNKKNIVTGIYFSNSLITDISSLAGLDDYLVSKIPTLMNPRLEAKVATLSFTDGFLQKTFFKFSAKELSQIVGAWKHAA